MVRRHENAAERAAGTGELVDIANDANVSGGDQKIRDPLMGPAELSTG